VSGIYLNVVVNNYRELKAAIDSCSSFSIVPEQLISKRLIKPTTHELVTVNQTSIRIVGQTKVQCRVDDYGFEVVCLVSPQVKEMVLRIPFLTDLQVQLNVSEGRITGALVSR